ncbi:MULTISPECIES: class I SAM-dependent methyltransferase [unclassified Pseudophaeobacter]|uniref:class I SAM-dependent methyltransferase n=1 Tax=unclassified Pseudophaeobacter TaxID=2637024 RepID=UPI000EFC0B8C|nr:class I SAM-dependent methyltransferase [Pseudophaeobacter sp. EL27]
MSLRGRLFYKSRKFYDDDFDWNTYTADSYERRLVGVVERDSQAVAKSGELSFDEATGHIVASGRPIHPNQQAILEAIGRLQPGSVHEVGCGAGDHLANGKALFPTIAFSGADRGQTQLDLAAGRHPELAADLSLQDLTMPFSNHWPRADFVYSQTVLMHIHTAVSHFVALANMVNSANQFVLLMENQQCHNFVADISNLWKGGHFNWQTMHMYRFDGSTGARTILLSKEEQDLPVLTSDEQLREGLKPSKRRLKRADEDSARGSFGVPLG